MTCILQQLSTPVIDFCNLVLVCSDIVLNTEGLFAEAFFDSKNLFFEVMNSV